MDLALGHKGYQRQIVICFWLYLFFLIFEGAFRKWIFPSFSNVFLIIRDPIALYVLWLGLKHNLVKSGYARFFIIISIVCFFTTLIFGHQNLWAALYGFRITGINLPAAFVFGEVLKKNDLIRIGKFVLFVSIIMTGIIFTQYFSPQSSWINRGVGGNLEGSGFQTLEDYFRPSGTFSFVSGMIGFEFMVITFFVCFIFDHIYTSKLYIWVLALLYLLANFVCLSRTVITQSCIVMLFFLVLPFLRHKEGGKVFLFLILMIVLFVILYHWGPFQIAFDNMTTRFSNASDAEGNFVSGSIGNRYGGSFYRAFFDTQNFSGKSIPFWGFGLGAGTHVGATILGLHEVSSFSFAEEPWSLIICESGYFLGGLILIVGRLFFPLSYSIKAIKSLKKENNIWAYFSIPFFFVSMITYQWSVPTYLGFTVIACSLMCATLKNH